MKIHVKYIKEGTNYRVADLERQNHGQFEIINEATFQRMLACEFIILHEIRVDDD